MNRRYLQAGGRATSSGARPLHERLLASVLGILGAALVRLLGLTLRIEWVGLENVALAESEAGSKIFVFWHADILILAYTHRRHRICVLVSQHRDGECMAEILRRLGFATARGSSSRGGLEGLYDMCKRARDGWDLAVTPDGPKGPRHRAQPGVIYISERSGLKILPTACVSAHKIVLGTWDRFEIPVPFSRVVVGHGKPLELPGELTHASIERYGRALEESLAELTSQLSRHMKLTARR
ncbi:MAG: lysophospholipid acyltransferase family protein [Candidatus Eisenbacteria bacterium]